MNRQMYLLSDGCFYSMEEIVDVGLDVYICPVKMRLAFPKKKKTFGLCRATQIEEIMWLAANLRRAFVFNRYASSQTGALHDKPRRFSGIQAHDLLLPPPPHRELSAHV